MPTLKPAPHQKEITIEQLYPDLTPDEQQEAAYWLGRYLTVIRRIFERLQCEQTQNLTDSSKVDTI